MIQVLDKKFQCYLSAEKIQARISELATLIQNDYQGKQVVFVVVLKGAFIFASDLIKQVDLPCEIAFIRVKSYQGTETTGRVDEIMGMTTDVYGKDVVVIEDIVDTGITIEKVIKILTYKSCKSIQIASLLYKKEAFKGEKEPKYIGFEIENKFVVGYGLDYNEKGRNLPEIYQLVD